MGCLCVRSVRIGVAQYSRDSDDITIVLLRKAA